MRFNVISSIFFCLQISFEEKKEELFEMVLHRVTVLIYAIDCFPGLFEFEFRFLQVSIPAWFTMDTRLGCLSVHLDTPQCFSAEMYAIDLNILGTPEDLKVVYIICLFFELRLCWIT